MNRSDLDIPEGTVWPSTDEQAKQAEDEAGPAIELGPGDQPPMSLDPDRDDAERNAAGGGWDGANEQVENDFEVEQLRRAQGSGAKPGDAEDDVPLT